MLSNIPSKPTLPTRTIVGPIRVVVFLLLPFFAVSAQSDLIDTHFLKIQPGVSTRRDVERMLGKHDQKRHIVDFPGKYGKITIMYSYGNCSVQKSKWAMPEWVVEEVHYSIDKIMPLRRVIVNLSAFKSKNDGDIATDLTYHNDEYGLSLVFDTKKETVTDVTIRPTEKQIRDYRC